MSCDECSSDRYKMVAGTGLCVCCYLRLKLGGRR